MSSYEGDTMKDPMIDRANRPSAIDYEASISDWKVADLLAVITATTERAKYTPIPELKPEDLKPELGKERLKPELSKPEKEILKGELSKVEKEVLKGEKEALKGEKEYSKPDPWREQFTDKFVDQVANRVVQILEEKGALKRG